MRLDEIGELSEQVEPIRAGLGDAVDLAAIVVKDSDGDGHFALVATEDGLYLRSISDDWPLVTGPSVADGMRPWDIVRHGLQGSVGWGDGAPGPGATVFRALFVGGSRFTLRGTTEAEQRALRDFVQALGPRAKLFAGRWPEGCETCGKVGWRGLGTVVVEVMGAGEGRRYVNKVRAEQARDEDWVGECGHDIRDRSILKRFLTRLMPGDERPLPAND